MSLKEGLRIAAAAVAAPVAGTIWWMLVDQIPPGQAFSSPFPYLLLGISWFLATPMYVVASHWVDGKLWRLLLLATIGASPFALKAVLYFLTPRDIFAAFLIFSTSWISAFAFWLVLRQTSEPEPD